MKSQAFEAPDPESLQSKSPFARKIESPIKALRVLRGRLIQSSIQNYATTIIQWGLKNYTSGKAVNDMFQAPPLRFSLNLRGNSIRDLDPLRDVVVAFHLDDPCELPHNAGRIA